MSLEPSTAPPTCMPSNHTEGRVGERPSHGDATCLVRTKRGEDERRQSTRGTCACSTAVSPAIRMNKKDVPENPKCTPRSRRQGVASLSASPRWLWKRKGVAQRGSPWAVTRRLWSCSFMVSCRAFSSWAQRVCASATRSSLQRTIGLLEHGQCELLKSNRLLCTDMLKGFWKDFKN